MKKVLTFVFAFAPTLFFAQISTPQPVKVVEETIAQPTTTIELNKTTHNFGTINEGDIVKTTYIITNTGAEPLDLNKPKVSCGCTTPSYPKEPVQPGESAEVEVQFNSNNKPNKQVKTVTLSGNFEGSPKKVMFTAFVTPKPERVENIKEEARAIKEANKLKEEAEKKAEQAQEETEDAQDKAEKQVKKAEKEIEKVQNKTEKQVKKAEKVRKKIEKQQNKVLSLEEKILKGETKLAAAKSKFDEKNSAGKLSPVAITKWEKKQRGKELAVEKLKAKLKSEKAKLDRLK